MGAKAEAMCVTVSIGKPTNEPVVRLDQRLFVIGRELDEKDVTIWMRDMLQTEVCNRQGRGRVRGPSPSAST